MRRSAAQGTIREFAMPAPSSPSKDVTAHHGWIHGPSHLVGDGKEPLIRIGLGHPRIDWPWIREKLGIARDRLLTGAAARACSLCDRQFHARDVGGMPDQPQQTERHGGRFDHGAHDSLVLRVDTMALVPSRGVQAVRLRGQEKEGGRSASISVEVE